MSLFHSVAEAVARWTSVLLGGYLGLIFTSALLFSPVICAGYIRRMQLLSGRWGAHALGLAMGAVEMVVLATFVGDIHASGSLILSLIGAYAALTTFVALWMWKGGSMARLHGVSMYVAPLSMFLWLILAGRRDPSALWP